jgi:hypothetical protein
MLDYDKQSWNMYENKGKLDKMPGEKSGFCIPTRGILQEITANDGNFHLNDGVGTGLRRNWHGRDVLTITFMVGGRS